MLCAFYGSFRFGELLPKNSYTFNESESLLWCDIKFVDGNSVIIHNKIPKTRNPNGEFISLFRFPDDAYCPINALLNLKKLSKVIGCKKIPVFSYGPNNFLTCKKMNEISPLHSEQEHWSRSTSIQLQKLQGSTSKCACVTS
jgi:hypothetical protein